MRDAKTGSVTAQGYDDWMLWSIAFAPGGATLVTTGNDGRVKLWDAATGDRIRGDDFLAFPRYTFDREPSGRGSMDAVFSIDGDRVISGGEDGQVFLWGMPEGNPLEAFSAGSEGRWELVHHVAVAPDFSWVAGSSDRSVHVWDTGTGERTTLEARGAVTALAVASDGSRLASSNSDGTVLVWRAPGFAIEARLDGHGGVRYLGFSPDGQLLYSGGGGEARAWDLSKPTNLQPSEESKPVQRVMMPLAHGTWAAIAAQNGDVQIRDVTSGEITATLPGRRAGVVTSRSRRTGPG